jgi:predicted AlkP superfamily pyrophosphatase or phosphodiesterase
MKTPLLLLVLSLVCARSLPAQSQNTQKSKSDRMVVVISLDGFPAYALDDPRLPIPTLRKLAREGSIASSMRPINPTVTWPNHTALVTGVDASVHHVLFNGSMIRSASGGQPTVEPQRAKDLMVQAPTVYDLAYNAGLTTAQVDWVAIYGAKTITWKFPELPDPNGEIEREMIDMGTITPDQLRSFEASSQAWQDEMWTDAAVDILQKHRPNLMLFHLLSLDSTNHEYGPMGEASFTSMAFLDDRVKQILDALQQADLMSHTTIIVVSDHGFRKIDRELHPNLLLQQKGLIRRGEGNALAGDAWVASVGGTANVYITDPKRRDELIPQIREALKGAQGIDQIWGPSEFSRMGWPTASQSDQAPDLVLTATPGYVFSSKIGEAYVTPSTEKGTHGYVNTDPQMQSIFIAWGAGIGRNNRIGSISNLDIAPTIADILGLKMDHTMGHSIKADLK